MAVYKDLIHGRLKLIVQNSGGYNFIYHINKVAKENNIDNKIVEKIFLMTTDKKVRNEYIDLIKKGHSMDYIKRLEDVRQIDLDLEFASILGTMSGISSKTYKIR